MESMYATILFTAYVCLYYAYFVLLGTNVHECTHFAVARLYKPCRGFILCRYNWFKKSPDIIWCKKTRGGQTILENDFLDYSDKQLRIIALAPHLVNGLLFLIGYVIFAINFAVKMHNFFIGKGFVTIVTYVIISGVILTAYFLFHGFIKNRKNPNHWNDWRIVFNPSGFREYMKTQRTNIGEDSYQYHLTEWSKINASQN